MKLAFFFVALAMSVSDIACSNNKCKFDSEDEKKALGDIADITQGAHSCDVEGTSPLAGVNCEIGKGDCVGTLNAIHPAPATVKDVAAQYRGFLEKKQYTVSEKPVKSKFANGKEIEGIVLSAKSGDKDITVRVFPFGTNMVETRVYLAAMEFYPAG